MSIDRLRRDLGTLESYAALIGILVGAGIYQVIRDVGVATGPSTILALVVLAPCVLATSVPYAIFGSTSLGRSPGGEATHIAETFGIPSLAFVGAWLRIVSYVGALAYLAGAFSGYLLAVCGIDGGGETLRTGIALSGLLLFLALHVLGVRWFGRVQIWMCALLGLSLVVLIGPGLMNVRSENLTPFFPGGASGFMGALPPLFFAYAGFEALAQTAGEVEDSEKRLPRVFLRGIIVTTVIFTLMAVVVFGTLPVDELATSDAPMEVVAGAFLPGPAVWLVTLGGLMAVATSLNTTMLVPSRLLVTLADDGRVPRLLGAVDPRTGTPIVGLVLTFAAAAALLLTGQTGVALGIAVFALFILYALHGLACLELPRRRPTLFAGAQLGGLRCVWKPAVVLSLLSMGGLIWLQVEGDLRQIRSASFGDRWTGGGITASELLIAWSLVGFLLALASRRWFPDRG